MENLESMTKPQLAAVYNELADKLGKPRTNRMESREAGIRRVRALLDLLPTPPKVAEKPKPVDEICKTCDDSKVDPGGLPVCRDCNDQKPTHASAAADTWRDENVRAARAMRHRVEVGGVEYRSVSAAFKALRLPLAKHSPFRGALVKAGTLDFQGHTFKVLS